MVVTPTQVPLTPTNVMQGYGDQSGTQYTVNTSIDYTHNVVKEEITQ